MNNKKRSVRKKKRNFPNKHIRKANESKKYRNPYFRHLIHKVVPMLVKNPHSKKQNDLYYHNFHCHERIYIPLNQKNTINDNYNINKISEWVNIKRHLSEDLKNILYFNQIKFKQNKTLRMEKIARNTLEKILTSPHNFTPTKNIIDDFLRLLNFYKNNEETLFDYIIHSEWMLNHQAKNQTHGYWDNFLINIFKTKPNNLKNKKMFFYWVHKEDYFTHYLQYTEINIDNQEIKNIWQDALLNKYIWQDALLNKYKNSTLINLVPHYFKLGKISWLFNILSSHRELIEPTISCLQENKNKIDPSIWMEWQEWHQDYLLKQELTKELLNK